MNVRHDMVTVFVIRPDAAGAHEFLQLRRAADDFLGGTWQTVRGTIEAGETAVQAAIRELREEAGLAPSELYRLGLIESFYLDAGDIMCHCVPFVAIIASDAVVTLNEEHDAFRWVPDTAADAAFMWPSEKPLLREIRETILAGGPAITRLLTPLPRRD